MDPHVAPTKGKPKVYCDYIENSKSSQLHASDTVQHNPLISDPIKQNVRQTLGRSVNDAVENLSAEHRHAETNDEREHRSHRKRHAIAVHV